MELKIKEIKDKKEWEDFLLECDEKTFLQSFNWGEFNKMMGNKIWRLGIYCNEQLIGIALVIKIQAKRGTFLFVPDGPSIILAKESEQNLKYEVLKILLNELKKIARNEKVSFIRIAPNFERNDENQGIFKNLGFLVAPIHIHPEVNWQLDIEGPEEEILKQMRKTTRYLVRQGLKNKEIEIYQSQDLRDIEKFHKLYLEAALRHHFTPFSLEYLKNEFLVFLPNNQIVLFLGKYKEELISGAMIIFWQNIAFYHQGASSSKHPKIPVSYLLQWEAIKEAKKRGCKTYNFWGIIPPPSGFSFQSSNFKRHPWAGFTLFKMGFGGYKKKYIKTQDLPLSKKYWLTYIFEKLRKVKRGF